jgi:hypothetical protein
VHLRGSGGVQKQSCTDNLFVLTRILQRLARPTKLSMRSFWTCAKRYGLEDGLSAKLLERCGWKVMAGPARPSY